MSLARNVAALALLVVAAAAATTSEVSARAAVRARQRAMELMSQ